MQLSEKWKSQPYNMKYNSGNSKHFSQTNVLCSGKFVKKLHCQIRLNHIFLFRKCFERYFCTVILINSCNVELLIFWTRFSAHKQFQAMNQLLCLLCKTVYFWSNIYNDLQLAWSIHLLATFQLSHRKQTSVNKIEMEVFLKN